MEVKDPSQPPSKRKLTPDQKIFHGEWDGELYVVETAEQAINYLIGRGENADEQKAQA
jgi:hypothetical protein